MNTFVGGLSFVVASVIGATAVAAQQQTAPPPPWAYGFAAPPPSTPAATPSQQGQRGGGGGAPPDTTPRTLPGSTASFTLAQIRDGFGPADWFPGDHPAMPPIVAQGRRDAMITACSLCHYPNGKGRPENAAVSGLPFSYIVQAMTDFKSDARKSSDPRKTNTNRMIAFAKGMTDEEIKAAATYFSSMKWTPWIRVVESDDAPKTRIAGGLFIAIEGADAGKEPLGQRIIETPENGETTETLRNPRSGFVAYVPMGSVKKGEALATRGQCASATGESRGTRSRPDRGSFTDVHGATDVRHAARHAQRRLVRADEACRRAAERGRHAEPAAYVASRAP
jgi:cytochrome c553